jgi:hypothetical protein
MRGRRGRSVLALDNRMFKNGAPATGWSLRPGAGRNTTEPEAQNEHDRGTDRPAEAATVAKAETAAAAADGGNKPVLGSEEGNAADELPLHR